ncbi:MAG: hypothetical protein KNU04_gp80 [crAssphage sp. isolate ctbg_1]|uniref:Uncharacterized protein n=1 Tax=crAssphage sp. isolate ctbg_1 TaxID=2989854 RepID=A0A345MT09_9CAUD|nr:MAG: hypothetical protein KNU04_gp80 [crAssphage sp. isolate ctbg_1]AXH74509.1 MAG: hypothetical protein [crAssphage sp. isolate ctbg_1]
MEKIMNKVNQTSSVASDKAAQADTAKKSTRKSTTKAAKPKAERKYPEIVEVVVRGIDYYEYQRTNDDGEVECDEKTGKPIIERRVVLHLEEEIDGILSEEYKFKIGKINRLTYSAYYLRKALADSAFEIDFELTAVEMEYGIKSMAKLSLMAALKGSTIRLKRTFHPKGEKYTDANGQQREFQQNYFERDILNIDVPQRNLDMFPRALEKEVQILLAKKDADKDDE